LEVKKLAGSRHRKAGVAGWLGWERGTRVRRRLALFGQNQFVLRRQAQAVNLPGVFDPHLARASAQLGKGQAAHGRSIVAQRSWACK